MQITCDTAQEDLGEESECLLNSVNAIMMTWNPQPTAGIVVQAASEPAAQQSAG
jgi:uncharacterized protein (UPF0548 family)